MLLVACAREVLQPDVDPGHSLVGAAFVAEESELEKLVRLRVVDVGGVGSARVPGATDVRDLFPLAASTFFVLAAVATVEFGIA